MIFSAGRERVHIAKTALSCRGQGDEGVRSPKISKKGGCEIFYKNEGLAKRRDSVKRRDA